MTGHLMLSPSPHTTTLLFPLVCAPVLCQAAKDGLSSLESTIRPRYTKDRSAGYAIFVTILRRARIGGTRSGPKDQAIVYGGRATAERSAVPRVRWLALLPGTHIHPEEDQEHLAQGCESDELPWE